MKQERGVVKRSGPSCLTFKAGNMMQVSGSFGLSVGVRYPALSLMYDM